MCGIFGVLNQSNHEPLKVHDFHKALDVIEHRGPDAKSVQIIGDNIGFGHRRLAIIDLQVVSNQPFQYEHLLLTFNGEIFNYLELRVELKKAGYQFRTEGDTEVIPAAYLHWGEECVNHFNGMWAFAIYDAKADTLFCSRDRFGIKPFNYSFANGRFAFASEIKSLLAFDQETYRQIHYNAISRYGRETVGAQAKETWFEGVFRLPPAHNITISRKGHEIKKYWSYPNTINRNLSYNDATEQYAHLFNESIKLRLRSDVPLGLTLSGGLDSASIAYQVNALINNRLNTYTASFPGYGFDEYPIAKSLSDQLNMNSIEVQLDYSNYVETLQKIVYHLESGHGSPAIFPLWSIAQRAKKDITVYLEGQGADELLGGYVNSIFVDFFLDLVKKGEFKRAFHELHEHKAAWSIKQTLLLYLRQSLPAGLRSIYRKSEGIDQLFQNELKGHLPYDFLPEEAHTKEKLHNRLINQHSTGLVNLLHYGDAISMAHSLENRLPFMDYRLVEFVFQLPEEYKIKEGLGKSIHRDVSRGIVPNSILDNRKKLGFVSPLKHVFSDTKFGALDILLSTKNNGDSFFNVKRMEAIIKEHKAGKRNHERILFKVLSTKLWMKNYF